MMMPNMVKYPIIMLPILITAAVSGVVGSLIGIAGTCIDVYVNLNGI